MIWRVFAVGDRAMFEMLPRQFGRYWITRELGRGGMGAVYLAEDTQFRRPVALKIPGLGAEHPEVIARFWREARAAAAVEHPNICPVYDVGQEEGVHYLTMAFVDGRPLSTFIDEAKPLSQRAVAVVTRKMALALQEAHDCRVVHRDLKPSNVMINQRGQPVIMDFGLARLTASFEEAPLTRRGALLGTPAYMAPEQVVGDLDSISPAWDVYSLGVMLYELLTGRRPFEGPTLEAVLGKILATEPERPSMHRPDLDAGLEAVCLRAMAKSPDERYVSMIDLAGDLTAYLRRAGPSPRGAAAGGLIELQPSGEINGPTDGTLTPPSPYVTTRRGASDPTPLARRRIPLWQQDSQRRGIGPWIAAAVGGVALLSAGVGVVATTGDDVPARVASAGLGSNVEVVEAGAELVAVANEDAVETPNDSTAREEPQAASEVPASGSAATGGAYALAFDGRSTHVTIPTLRYSGSHPITVEATVRPSRIPNGYILSDFEQGGFALSMSALGAHNGKSYAYARIEDVLPTNEWVHVAGVLDGERLSFFLNGMLQSTMPLGGRYKRSPLAAAVGANPSWDNRPAERFVGLIRQVRVSNVARYTDDFEPEEVLGTDLDTLALYRFDEGQGSLLHNAAHDVHHGIIFNPKWVRLEP